MRKHPCPSRHAAGASLLTAIFLLVVLAGLGVALVTLATGQQAGAALDQQGSRAYLAARAGAEWGVYRVTRASLCAASSSFALPAGTSLSTFSVTVLCTASTDALTGTVRYQVKSTSCNQAGSCPSPSNNPDYVQRVIQVEFSAPGVP